MAHSTITPTHSSQPQYGKQLNNPFATPTFTPADSPTLPQPVAQVASSRTAQETGSRPSTRHGGTGDERLSYSYKSQSMSSDGTMSTISPISSMNLEKGRADSPLPKKHRTSKDQRSLDPEKAMHSPTRTSYDRRRMSNRVAYLEEDEMDDTRLVQEKKAVQILLFLSGPAVVLSFLNAIWTLISLIITSLAQPVRLCARRATFGQQLSGLLGPSLNLQLKSIYTPLPPHADEDLPYRPGMLLLVQLLSPCHSLGIMMAAWVVWIYWISSAVVGDPSGTDKRDDGRETALMLRNWWERWLVKSMNEADL